MTGSPILDAACYALEVESELRLEASRRSTRIPEALTLSAHAYAFTAAAQLLRDLAPELVTGDVPAQSVARASRLVITAMEDES